MQKTIASACTVALGICSALPGQVITTVGGGVGDHFPPTRFQLSRRPLPTVDSAASGVRHTDCTLTRAVRARFTFSSMSEAEAVHMKGFGRWLW
jgi:hypothetical protein